MRSIAAAFHAWPAACDGEGRASLKRPPDTQTHRHTLMQLGRGQEESEEVEGVEGSKAPGTPAFCPCRKRNCTDTRIGASGVTLIDAGQIDSLNAVQDTPLAHISPAFQVVPCTLYCIPHAGRKCRPPLLS